MKYTHSRAGLFGRMLEVAGVSAPCPALGFVCRAPSPAWSPLGRAGAAINAASHAHIRSKLQGGGALSCLWAFRLRTDTLPVLPIRSPRCTSQPLGPSRPSSMHWRASPRQQPARRGSSDHRSPGGTFLPIQISPPNAAGTRTTPATHSVLMGYQAGGDMVCNRFGAKTLKTVYCVAAYEPVSTE